MMTLYYSPGACSLAPHIVLEELHLPFEAHRVAIADGENKSPEFRGVNPKERVPALVVDGEVLTEVPALLGYLASLRPEANLLPAAGSVELGRCLSFLAFLSSSLHIAYAQLWRPERFLPADYPAQEQEKFTSHGKALIQRFNREIEDTIEDDWVLGAGYSVADGYLLPFYRWGVRIGLPMARELPRWTAWKDRMLERPAVLRAIEREQLGTDWESV